MTDYHNNNTMSTWDWTSLFMSHGQQHGKLERGKQKKNPLTIDQVSISSQCT